MFRSQLFVALCAGLVVASAVNAANGAKYDPLAIDANFRAHPLELTVHDANRNRGIPVLVYLPGSIQPAPVVLFSHGLGGARNGNEFLGQHWAARGYVAVFVQHPGRQAAGGPNECDARGGVIGKFLVARSGRAGGG